MSDIAERLTGIVARSAGNIVNPAVTALMQAAAIATGNIDLAIWANPAGAVAGSITEEGAMLVRRAWSGRSERVEQFAADAEAEAGMSIDDLMELAANDVKVLQILGTTVQSATEANDRWRIQMLAKVFVAGAKDPAKVDELVYLTEALKGAEAPEIRALAVMASEAKWWTHDSIEEADPGLRQVLPMLIRRLKRLDLIEEQSSSKALLVTRVGIFCAECLKALGAMPDTGNTDAA